VANKTTPESRKKDARTRMQHMQHAACSPASPASRFQLWAFFVRSLGWQKKKHAKKVATKKSKQKKTKK